jgi:hydroxyacylglutathione hydrolase
MLDVLTIETNSLGDRSYLATDGRVAVVVDPQRDIDRVLRLADERGVRITHVLETHVHNDYVTGGYQLARATGGRYVLHADDRVEFDRVGVRDGDVLEVSPGMRVRVLATPGHTFTHLAYVLEDHGEVRGVFTGGSLLYGSTGRPDLLGPEHAETLARHQHASVRRLVAELPSATPIYPTHGFGSFCTTTPAQRDVSTLGVETTRNLALTADVEEFVQATLAGLDAYPAYYSRLAPVNRAGPAPVDLSPPAAADAAELRRRIDAGEWVVDLRIRTAFAAGHVRGAFYFGKDGRWATYLGWLIPWGTPVTLLASTEHEVAAAQRELVRIGIDRPAAAATGSPHEWSGPEPPEPLPLRTFADLRARLEAHGEDRVVVLDVRRRGEWQEGHLSGAVSIPLHELLGRLDDVPLGQVWTHCTSGFRSTIAASLLQATGRDVVGVDDAFDQADSVGLAVVTRDEGGSREAG